MDRNKGQFDRFIVSKLNLIPRSDTELHNVLSSFEQKWQIKARHALNDGGRAS